MIKDAQPKILRRIISLPKKGYSYFWIIPTFDDSAVGVRGTAKRTEIKINAPLVAGLVIIKEGDTHLIPRDFLRIRNKYNPSLFIGIVPGNNEVAYFVPLTTDQIEALPDCDEKLDKNLYSRLGGVFITMDLKTDIYFFRESMHQIFDITDAFFQEVNEMGLNLFDSGKLWSMWNLDLFRF